MKSGVLYFMSLFVTALLFSTVATAQYDDIYFDPEDNASGYYTETSKVKSKRVEDQVSSDQPYDYYYSSRIRRFERPYVGFDYFSPAYVYNAYYDPFFTGFYDPYASIYYSNSFRYRTVYGSRVLVNNIYGPSWGYPAPYGGSFVSIGTFSTFGGGFGGGFSPAFAGGIGGFNAYCPPSVYTTYNNPSSAVFGNPGNGTTASANSRGTSYGPRTSGTVSTSPRVQNPRAVPAPDRPIAGTRESSAADTRSISPRRSYTNPAIADRSATYNPRSERPDYRPPSNFTRSSSKSRSAIGRFTSSRPSRPTYDSYTRSSSSRSFDRPSTFSRPSTSSRSTFSRPSTSSSRFSGSSSRSFSSPRSSSSMSRSSSPVRSSPRGRN